MFAFLAVMALLMSSSVLAKDEYKEAKIKTTVGCDDCKAKVEKSLKKAPGVKSAKVDMKEQVVTVKYSPAKTDETKLTKLVDELSCKDHAGEAANKSHEGCSAAEKAKCAGEKANSAAEKAKCPHEKAAGCSHEKAGAKASTDKTK